MKNTGMLAVVVMLFSGWITSYAQRAEPEVPGDHFSLEGALELFKKSASPQEFERMLNSPDSKVNNLDLNGDGYIDYIRVHDRYEGNVHAFILQAVISDREIQDVAVIELEKLSNGKAVLQIVGDEDVYGVTTIIEPTREVRTYAGTTSSRTVVNVWAWPSVQYVYGPYYDGWASPWGWNHRPVWYRSWRPIAYMHYYPIWRPYRTYYVPCYTRRVEYAHHIYHPHRATSVVVVNRHHDQLTRYRSERRDDYRNGRGRDDHHSARRRDDDRRSYTSNSGSSSLNADGRRRQDLDLNRRSTQQRERTVSPARSARDERSVPSTRQRTVPGSPNIHRNSPVLKREEVPHRRSGTFNNNPSIREQASPPAVNRNHSSGRSEMQQRVAVRPRSAPANIQRSSPSMQRETLPGRNSGRMNNTPQIRQQVNRPAAVDRSSGVSRSPSVKSRRSSGSHSIQQRSPNRSPGATRSVDGRRGRE